MRNEKNRIISDWKVLIGVTFLKTDSRDETMTHIGIKRGFSISAKILAGFSETFFNRGWKK